MPSLLFFIAVAGAFLLDCTAGLFAAAAPHGKDFEMSIPSQLETRQIVEANPTVQCCTSCKAKYGYSPFWNVFDNLCTYMSSGVELWTDQTYNAGNYYCKSNPCIHVSIKYLCGGGSATTMSYDGCMGYFDFVIQPGGTCGGPPYPGAQVHSPDGCWVFQATADLVADFTKKRRSDVSAASWHAAGDPVNTTAPVGADWTFG